MKKIYYLLAFIAVAITFASCDPLSKTYKQVDAAAPARSANYTLVAADYKLLPTTVAANKSASFTSTTDANTNIPTILNSKFYDYPDGSNISVTYATPVSVVVADSVFADVAYTLTAADYLLLPGNKFTDFSVAQMITWLPYKYPTPVANQLAVVSYTLFDSGVAPNANTETDSFLYLNGAWVKIYMVSPTQYASVGRGALNEFTSADDATNIIPYLNNFLKADGSVSGTAKAGDVKYVSYKYFVSSTKIYQRVQTLVFDGTNWAGTINASAKLTFFKSKGTWIPDPSIYYTLTTADTKLIAASTIGTAAQRTNLGSFGDFSGWAAADLQSAMILVLTTDFKTPQVNIPYKVTYLLYTGKDIPTILTFTYNGTTWVPQS